MEKLWLWDDGNSSQSRHCGFGTANGRSGSNSVGPWVVGVSLPLSLHQLEPRTLRSDPMALQFRDSHHTCTVCGIHTFTRPRAALYTINVRCLDDFDLSKEKVEQFEFDGHNWPASVGRALTLAGADGPEATYHFLAPRRPAAQHPVSWQGDTSCQVF